MQSLGFNIVGLSSRVQNFWMWTVGLQTTVASEQYAAGQARPRRPAEGASRQAAAPSNRQSAPDQLRPAVRGCGSLWRQPCQRHGCSCQQAKGQGPSQEGHLAQAVQEPALVTAVLYAQLPLWDMQQQKDVLGAVPLWLPHELLYKLQGKAANDSSMCNLDMLEEGELLGIWGDGVPLTRDRAQSAELLTLNKLTSAKRGALRLPLAMMQKHLMVKQATWDGVLAIMAWSLQHAAAGTFPCSRHDGAPWTPEPAPVPSSPRFAGIGRFTSRPCTFRPGAWVAFTACTEKLN